MQPQYSNLVRREHAKARVLYCDATFLQLLGYIALDFLIMLVH